jgi:hypothetical protein
LALYLAQPSQIGVPPNNSELLDTRTLYWPGYERPVTCYLFRFTYAIGDAEFSSIGIAGPLTHAFGADLSDLSPDDIYAAFAGWQAEGEEIVETDVADASDAQQLDVTRLRQKAADAGCQAIQPLTLGGFFGTSVLIAAGERNGTPGVLVVDDQRIYWWPRAAGRRPIGPLEAYCIYKGQKLLRAFNP